MLLNPEWLNSFPSIKVSLLKRSVSDHCPLLICSKETNSGPKPFRFQNCWLSHPQCMSVIKESWSASQNQNFPEKLRAVKENLKKWNITSFGHIEDQIKSLENKINDIDLLSNSRALNDDELQERRKAQFDLWD